MGRAVHAASVHAHVQATRPETQAGAVQAEIETDAWSECGGSGGNEGSQVNLGVPRNTRPELGCVAHGSLEPSKRGPFCPDRAIGLYACTGNKKWPGRVPTPLEWERSEPPRSRTGPARQSDYTSGGERSGFPRIRVPDGRLSRGDFGTLPHGPPAFREKPVRLHSWLSCRGRRNRRSSKR